MFRPIIAAFLLLAWANPSNAGPGHDHDGGHATEGAQPVAGIPRIESTGAGIELVATAEGHKLTIYLDRLDTNEPVEGAVIEVSGEGISAVIAKPSGTGTYELEAEWVDRPGARPLVFMVTAGPDSDLLNGTLNIPGASDGHTPGIASMQEVLTRKDVLAAVLGALVLGFFIAVALRPRRPSPGAGNADADLTETQTSGKPRLHDAAEVIVLAIFTGAMLALVSPVLAGPGHDHGDGGHEEAAPASGNAPRKLPDGSVFVPKPTQRLLAVRTRPAIEETVSQTRQLIGTVIPDPSAFGQVQAPMDGQIEVTDRGISFAGQKVTAGEVLAMLSPTIPLADLGTLQQLRAEVEGKLKIAEQKLARISRISNVIAQRDIDDTKAELDALREQKRVLAPKGIEKIQLKASVSGVISVANVRAGQVVSARDTLFEIVDPTRLWVEGIGPDIHSEGEIATAHARDADGHEMKLSYVGRSPALRQQSQPFLFRIEHSQHSQAIGAPVTVLVQTQDRAKGIVLPEGAVVRGLNGLPQVWVKVSPERFRPVAVRTSAIEGARVLAIAGLEPGARIVIGGAELINQIR
ncbi:MAG: HlyD family efflux transporter periplasmic adaptor subunit [Hyphomicrobium sp.]